MKRLNYFPLVGILASKGKEENSFRGDSSVFKSIQNKLEENGGLSFVFTTDSIHTDYILGYLFLKHKKKWGKVVFPFPDLIYNKISSRTEETSRSFLTLQQKYIQQGKPFFNSTFFNKWEIHSTLSENKYLRQFLPKTWLYSDHHHTINLLQSNHPLYIKPINGHKGKEIYKISTNESSFHVQSKNKTHIFNKSSFLYWLDHTIKKQPFLLQEEIQTEKVDGCKYDLRILCLYKDGIHTIQGIGVRKATKKSFLTHVPNGGEIISFEKVRHKCSIDQLNEITEKTGKVLSDRYGFIGEFSMDVGITNNGSPYIFEINSKPMIFDEKQIQEDRITQLAEMFGHLATKNSNW